MGNKSSTDNTEKKETIFKSDLNETQNNETTLENNEQCDSIKYESNLLKTLNASAFNSGLKESDINEVSIDFMQLSDKDKFILKLKFILMCHYTTEKQLKFNINNITNEHINLFVKRYNFNNHIKEIEQLMPNKLIKTINHPFVFPHNMVKQMKNNEEIKNQLNQLVVKYFKQIDPTKISIDIVKDLFSWVTKKYYKCLSAKQSIILCSKLKGIDLNSELVSENEFNDFLKSISFDSLIGLKKLAEFNKLSTKDKVNFIINSNDETYNKFNDIKQDVFLYSCNLNNDDDKTQNEIRNKFSKTFLDFICEELNCEQINNLLSHSYELEKHFEKNESYTNEHDKISFAFYQEYYFPTLSEEEQLKKTHYSLTLDDQYELYKLNEELYVKVLCNYELILEITFKPYYLNEFGFLNGFSESIQTYLKNKIKFDENAVTLEGMPEGPIKTLDDLIDVFIFTFDPPKFLYKKDLLDIHPNNIQLIRESAKAIGYNMNKYSYKKFKLVMSLAETEDIEEIINYNNSEYDDEDYEDKEYDNEENEDKEYSDEEYCEDDVDHYNNKLEYEANQAEQYLKYLKSNA